MSKATELARTILRDKTTWLAKKEKLFKLVEKICTILAPLSPMLWPCGQLLVASGPHTSASTGQVNEGTLRLAIHIAPHVKQCTIKYYRMYFVMTHTKQGQYQRCDFPYL